MILTIQQILDSFGDDIPKLFKDTMGSLDPSDEIIRKQLPASAMRFEEGETAIIGVISSLRKDRDDEVLLPEGMDDSNYSGVVLWQHDYWRGDIPHARSLYRQLDPKSNPYRVLAKTAYLTDISELGANVYDYRKAEYPLGQSVGFRSKESVRKGDSGYDEIYKEWKERVKAMLKEKKVRATSEEFSEPRRIFTKWELWEYSDVYIGSNVDALQVAVNKGIVSPAEAKSLVSFESDDYGEKPFANEHACRLEDPDQFDKFRRDNCGQKHDDKCIDVIYGIKDGKSKIQALRYPKKIWTEAAAKSHCKSRNGTFEAAKKSADVEILEDRIIDLETKLNLLLGKGEFTGLTPLVDLEKAWDNLSQEVDLKKKTFDKMWENATE